MGLGGRTRRPKRHEWCHSRLRLPEAVWRLRPPVPSETHRPDASAIGLCVGNHTETTFTFTHTR